MATEKLHPIMDPTLQKKGITIRFCIAVRNVIMYRRHGVKNIKQVCELIGLPWQNYSKLDNRLQNCSVEHVARLCSYFQISDAYIMRGVGGLEENMMLTIRIDALEKRLEDVENQLQTALLKPKK
jgi:hypothetical protein